MTNRVNYMRLKIFQVYRKVWTSKPKMHTKFQIGMIRKDLYLDIVKHKKNENT